MILEAAILNVKSGQGAAFEAAMATARPLIAASEGFEGLELRPCLEARTATSCWCAGRGSRTTPRASAAPTATRDWKAALHHFYQPFPSVEHYGPPL